MGESLGESKEPVSEDDRKPAPATVDFYDGVSEGYAELYRSKSPGSLAFRIRKQRLLEMFDRPGGSVLDLGCGTGVITDELLELGCRIVGLDPAPGMIAQAKIIHESKEGASFAVGFAERIDQPDESFDAVICMGVFERVANPEASLAEMHRVLKPGGTILVTLTNQTSPYILWRNFVHYPIAWLLQRFYHRLRGSQVPVHVPDHKLYSAQGFGRDLARHGSQVTDVQYTIYNPVLPPLELLLPGLAVSLIDRLEGLRNTPLRTLGAGFILKATKK